MNPPTTERTSLAVRLAVMMTLLLAAARDGADRLAHDEDGLTTTEVAVVTFLLVGAAIVVVGIIYAAARTNAENIPHPIGPRPVTNGQRWTAEDGIAATQLAVLMPAVLLLIMLTVQFALWAHGSHLAAAAADVAAAAAALPTGSAGDAEVAARDLLAQSGNLADATVAVVIGPTTTTATVRATAPQLVPGIRFGVEAIADAPRELFVPEDQR